MVARREVAGVEQALWLALFSMIYMKDSLVLLILRRAALFVGFIGSRGAEILRLLC